MSATPEKMIEMIIDCSLTPMVDELANKRGKYISFFNPFVNLAKTLELRMHAAEDALEELAPFLRGQLENDILTSKYQDAVKMALAVVDTPNPNFQAGGTL